MSAIAPAVSGLAAPAIDCADLDAAVKQVLAPGATLAPDVYDGDSWVVLRDPEGNEFCLLRPRG